MKIPTLFTNYIHNSLGRFLLRVSLVIGCFAISQLAQAVSPPPDGGYPNFTTAEGNHALNSLTSGFANTAVGWFSLSMATTGSFNTGVGAGALDVNNGNENTATGTGALLLNTTGVDNTANGAFALVNNSTGQNNTAVGDRALQNTTGNGNTAIGREALANNTTGSNNCALGPSAGLNATTGSNNVYIGAGTPGVAGESNACYIASIFGQTSFTSVPVEINSDFKLGTPTSSKRFKEAIKPMDKTSEVILALKPVTFHYKKEIDPAGTSQFGLVAEDVEKVNPNLIVRDKEGKPYSVRYDQVNAMLLNEFLKEHRHVQQQDTTIADLKSTVATQQKQIEALSAGLQKVSAQLEASKAAPQVVNNP